MSTKVFVGNLSFSTRENELAEEFESAGKVVKANIITRGPRSLGYGFVEMADEAAALNAVKVMDKKTIDGRQINVEVAKVPGPGETSGERPPRASGRPPRARGPRAPRAAPSATTTAGAASTGAAASTNGGEAAPARSRRRPRRPRRRTEGAEGAEGGEAAASGSAAPARTPAPRKTSTPTSLFVANLPFAVDDAQLHEIFAEFKPHIRSAHVVVKANGRSKGFGFVDFDATESQHAAMKALDKKVVDGRELSIKIALVGEQPAEASATTAAAGEVKK